jgi:phosphoglycolate phosphatase-like HAD superfamily hydrolase
MIRCIAFDFDGTLAESNAIKREAYYDASAALGEVSAYVSAALAEEPGNRERVCSAIVRHVSAAGSLPPPPSPEGWVPHLVELYTRRCEDAIAACPEVPGARAALEAMRGRGYALYVNSATPTEPLRRILALRGLSGLFSGVLGSPGSKAENLRRVLTAESASSEELLFVGDNEVDRAAALEIGCRYVGLENPFSGYAARPEALIRDMRDLPSAVEQMAARSSAGTATEGTAP